MTQPPLFSSQAGEQEGDRGTRGAIEETVLGTEAQLVFHLNMAATCIKNGWILGKAQEALDILAYGRWYPTESDFELGQRVKDKRSDRLGTVVSLSGNNYEEGCLEVWFDRAERFEPTQKVDLEAIASYHKR